MIIDRGSITGEGAIFGQYIGIHIINQSQHFCLLDFVVLYGCEAWSLTLREERRLRVFENRILM